MSFKLKNKDIIPLLQILFPIELKGKESRMKTRFIKKLEEYFENVFNVERLQLINEYAEKDYEGNPIQEDGHIKLVKETIPEFEEEYCKLENECFIMLVNDETKDMLKVVFDILLEGDFVVPADTAESYYSWCEQAECLLEEF